MFYDMIITKQRFQENMFGNRVTARGRMKMKKIVGIVLTAIALTVMPPFQLDNAYLRSSDFDTVTVTRRDTVWSIASRYTTDEKQMVRLTQAIIEVNGLSPEAVIRTGQRLRVPVLRRDDPLQLAGR